EQKSLYLAKLVTGEWTATMVLTEPQAGSDVGALRVKATKQSDGSYLIEGTKIYISYGDHDMAENIIHMVLARLPDAPAGTKGISLFLVPKFLVNADGSLGARNDVKPVGLEHKLGIHASPTCVMAFGENQGAVGYLVGGENNGMACMFSMMNAARLNVGLQGVAIAERAYQQALAYARERRQGKSAARRLAQSGPVEIIEHPDVRRMLLTMKATTEAIRAICYANAVAIDEARHLPDDRARAKAKLREELLTPISKGFATDMAVEVASLGIQVHGGMGYIEETGAAQHLRDARILPIYEGTNGIQAMDLATRKLSLNGGAAVAAFIDDMGGCVSQLMNSHSEQLRVIGTCLEQGVAAVDRVTEWLTARLKEHPRDCLSGATPYLRLFGLVSGGYLLGLGAIAANDHLVDGSSGEDGFYKSKISIAKFYAQNILPQAQAWASAAVTGADQLYELTPDQMAG
ncbi:MAG: acyl-CoA dehydrogenase, partial [Alphaproteobacteria bacterium]